MTSPSFLTRLRGLRTSQDVVLPGEKTTRQWAEEWGVSVGQAGHLIRAGVAAGLMRCRKRRGHRIDGSPSMIPYYAEITRKR